MAKITIGFAAALMVLGIGGFVASSAKTALIPAYVGVVLLVLGIAALKPEARKHAMHAAAAVGLLGFLASAGRLIAALATGKSPTALAAFSLGGMAILTLVFLILCIRSFIAARKARLGSS